jgi:hypothetical protein
MSKPSEATFLAMSWGVSAGLVIFEDAANKKLDSEHRFPAARSATDDRRAPFGQAAAADFVKSMNTRGRFLKRRKRANRRLSFSGQRGTPQSEKGILMISGNLN